MGTKKVLFINRFYHPHGKAGPAFLVQSLAEQLAIEGDEAIVLCFGVKRQPIYEIVNNVRVYRLPVQAARTHVDNLIDEVLERESPHVVHTNWLGNFDLFTLGGLIKRKGARLVHTVQEYGFICKTGIMFKNGKNCETPCDECIEIRPDIRAFVSHIDALVCVSQHTLSRHEERSVFDEIREKHVIYNSYKRVGEPIVRKEKEKGELTVGFLGRVVPEKGIEYLFEEIGEIQKREAIRLLIAGECQPKYKQYLLDRFSNVRASFLGFVPPQELFSQIDVLAVPSIWQEPFGRCIIEAYAHGVPVVVSNRGGIPEIVDESKTGYVYDPNVKRALCDCLELLLSDTEMLHRIGGNALLAVDKFLPGKILGEYRKVYFGDYT